MKIACYGDSWTDGFGLDPNQRWPYLLGRELKSKCRNFGISGSSNEKIFEQYKITQGKYDTLIFCWSSVTRLETPHGMMDFSYVIDELLNERINFYNQFTLQDLFTKWEDMMTRINLENPNKKILHFSVFGDMPTRPIENFYKPSMLEYLANLQGNILKYDIPIFEFDWLIERNLSLTEPFAKKYFSNDWKKAIVERENIRPGKNFLNCGHPNAIGAKLWSKLVTEKLGAL